MRCGRSRPSTGDRDARRTPSTPPGRWRRPSRTIRSPSLELAELALDMGRLDEASSAFQRLRSVDDDPSHEVYAFHGLIEVELAPRGLATRARPGRRRDARRPARPHRPTSSPSSSRRSSAQAERPGPGARAGRVRAGALPRRAPPPAPGGLVMAQAAAPPKPGTDVQWTRCPSCDAFVYYKRLKRNLGVCPECNHHFRHAPARRASSSCSTRAASRS